MRMSRRRAKQFALSSCRTRKTAIGTQARSRFRSTATGRLRLRDNLPGTPLITHIEHSVSHLCFLRHLAFGEHSAVKKTYAFRWYWLLAWNSVAAICPKKQQQTASIRISKNTHPLFSDAGNEGHPSPVISTRGLLPPSPPWREEAYTAPQHFLNLRPLPQGQGSFRPTFGWARRYGSTVMVGEGSTGRGASSG